MAFMGKWSTFWAILLLQLGPNFGCHEESLLPSIIRHKCICHNGTDLHCKDLSTTDPFRTPKPSPNDIVTVENPYEDISQLYLEESHFDCLNPDHFIGFLALKSVTVINSDLKSFLCTGYHSQPDNAMSKLNFLNLSGNKIKIVRKLEFEHLVQLEELNLSNNKIETIEHEAFATLTQLRKLDLSNNALNEHLKPSVLKTLPTNHLSYLDVSNNTWACSAQLAWMHKWKALLKDPSMLQNIEATRCIHEIHHTSRLFLVMKYYDEIVLPHCPLEDGCTCLIHSIQDTIITTRKRHYTVHVNCAARNLAHFPALPEHTQAVDLSDNQLDDTAFVSLDVKRDHYDEVENLTLDGNKLKDLPEKLLEMNLGMRFSAKNNQLTSISYDVTQRLIKNTDVLELSQNPWKCTCSSQINDLNLLAKVEDRLNLTCGPDSDVELSNKRIDSIDPEVLCPPSSTGESQELVLQFVCVFLAIAIVAILSKLAYDFRVYRTRGQLPRLALYMH